MSFDIFGQVALVSLCRWYGNSLRIGGRERIVSPFGALPVEVMLADPGGDCGIEDGLRVSALVKGRANGACRSKLCEVGQQVEVGCAAAIAAQAKHEVIRVGIIAGGDGETGGQSGGQLAEIKAGTRGHGEIAGQKQIGGVVPAPDAEERVGAHETDDVIGRGKGGAQGTDGIDGVIRPAVLMGSIDEGKLEAGLALDEQAGHGDPVGEAGLGAVALERLDADRSEEHAIEAEAIHGEACQRNMAAVRRIKAAAEEANLHAS